MCWILKAFIHTRLSPRRDVRLLPLPPNPLLPASSSCLPPHPNPSPYRSPEAQLDHLASFRPLGDAVSPLAWDAAINETVWKASFMTLATAE